MGEVAPKPSISSFRFTRGPSTLASCAIPVGSPHLSQGALREARYAGTHSSSQVCGAIGNCCDEHFSSNTVRTLKVPHQRRYFSQFNYFLAITDIKVLVALTTLTQFRRLHRHSLGRMSPKAGGEAESESRGRRTPKVITCPRLVTSIRSSLVG